MAKSGTGHTREKSDSKKVARKLQELTKKLSDKSIYAVKKHYDVFAVAEIKTNASVVKDLPTYEIADRFTNKLNRGHAKIEHINRRLPALLTEYQRKQFDRETFLNIINKSNDVNRRYVMYDRLELCDAELEDLLEKISHLAWSDK